MARARQLALVNWAIKDTAITRIVDLAVSGGLLAKDVPTFAVWVQSAVRFRAEANAGDAKSRKSAEALGVPLKFSVMDEAYIKLERDI